MKRWLTALICHKLTIVALFISFPLYCTQNTYYIKPTADTPCPGDPCHTLSQYAEQNFSLNATLVFLPGDHTLNFTISLGSLSNSSDDSQPDHYYPPSSLTLLGSPSSLPEITSRIVCTWPAGFLFSGITVQITALAFISCGHNDSAAIHILSVRNIGISKCIFQNNTNNRSGSSEYGFGGAIHVQSSNLTLEENTFQHNFAQKGGALEVFTKNTVTLSRNTFHNNSADSGGGLYAHANNTLTLSDNTFQSNSVDWYGGALYANIGNSLTLSENIFYDNSAKFGGALYVYPNNSLILSENTFWNNNATKSGGAVVAATNNVLTVAENTFQDNSAEFGGALYAHINNSLNVSNNTFQDNCADYGGALYGNTNNTITVSHNTLQDNSADLGGAFYTHINNTLNFSNNTFQDNSADYGGVLYAYANNTITASENTLQNNFADLGGTLNTNIGNTLTLSENTFKNNSAVSGGALFAFINNMLNISNNTFQNNSAHYSGGVFYAFTSNTLTLSNNTFQSNSAVFDGGVLVVRQSTVNLTNNTLTGNTAELKGGAVFCLSNSTLQVHGSHRLQNNTAQYGGGIAALECSIVLAGDLLLESNSANFGGGLYADLSQVNVSADFSNNFANADGGGIYASRSLCHFKQCITFNGNSAQNGGGLLLTDGSRLYLQPNTTAKFTNNSAMQKGGAIKVEKSNPLRYCVEVSCGFLIERDCFFQIQTERTYDFGTNITDITELHNIRMYFQNNTAREAGDVLYGGSVDNCSLSFINRQLVDYYQLNRCPKSGEVFDYITTSDEQSQLDITSDPLYICSCEGGEPDCSSSSITRSVYPGGKIEVPIIAYGQRNGTTPAVVHNITPRRDITFNEPENTQSINNSCTFLSYTVQTRAIGTTQEITLYVDDSCPPKERAITRSSSPTNVIKVRVFILQCPPGFDLLQLQTPCNCAQRLGKFTNTCRIEDGKIERATDDEFWVGYTPDNTSDGLILHPHCPFDYCTSNELYIAVDDSDKQCSNNRMGLLCGQCAQNFSLALGTNRCLPCSNDYLWLIVAFAFAGVALVLLILVLRLTVAVGTINGLVFYANILAMNSATFSSSHTNVLTVFIAWLNLDLGIETCFYDGMDAYAKAWLQFAFPFYVWALVAIIIFISHYSSKVANILGTNPIAVLATLFLLSYSKLLRTVIAALYYTLLEYPNNSNVAVWLYDGNMRYLSNKHIPLFIGALVCLIVLFLPYTLFLIFSQWLRSKSGQCKMFSWVNSHRVIPFMEAYHAPYTDKHRYWTGLMLLVRCILFFLFAFNALGDPSINLLAIGCVTAILPIVYALLGNRIYKTWYLNTLELSYIINLGILALATFYVRSTGGNQNAVTFTSISVAFATFIGILIYHSAQQIKCTQQLWRKLFPRNDTYVLVPQTDEDSDLEDVSPPSPLDPSDGCATVTHINIRELLVNDLNELQEPCLEMDN